MPSRSLLILSLVPLACGDGESSAVGTSGISGGASLTEADDGDDGEGDDDDDGPQDATSDEADDGSEPGETGDVGEAVLIDENCIDGAYIVAPPEQFLTPDQFPPIDDLMAGYSSAQYYPFMLDVLERRYPTGKRILELGGKEQVDLWIDETSIASPEAVFGSFPRVVHDVGHYVDRGLGLEEKPYLIAVDDAGQEVWLYGPAMQDMLSTSNSPQFSIGRGWLLVDDENAKRPPRCFPGIVFQGECGDGGEFGVDETVAAGYLSGNLEDDLADSGDQGYNMLVEEMLQYTTSVAVAYYFSDFSSGTSTLRHTMMTFMWWQQRFLRKIRLEHPEQYQYVIEHPKWVETILTLWGRSWLYVTAGLPGLQPDTDQLHALLRQPHLLEEIQRFRAAAGCDNPVELLPEFAGL